jgi:hypothetical protein
MKRSLSILADTAAAAELCLAADLRASRAGDTMTGPAQARTIAEDRRQAIDALEQLADALPSGHPRKVIALLESAHVSIGENADTIETMAKKWQRWADGEPGSSGSSGAPAAA